MPAVKKDPLDQVFMALADGTRRQIIKRLAQGELPVSNIAKDFEMSLAAVSKHIKVLENAKMVSRRVEGRQHFLSLVPEQLADALDWISIYRNFWLKRMDALAAIVETNIENQED